MAVFFEGNAFIDECLIQNTDIKNSVITASSIDMNLSNIVNVKDPVVDQDAATKKYVDDNTSFITTDVSLAGTTGSMVLPFLSGSYLVKVKNLTTDGPTATFHVTKSEPSLCGQTNRFSATTGTSDTTTLKLTWQPNSEIYLHKTNASYDGDYRVVFL